MERALRFCRDFFARFVSKGSCKSAIARSLCADKTSIWDRKPAPTSGMRIFQSSERVIAGEITEVVPAGCYVQLSDGTKVLREFTADMHTREYVRPGDFWLVYLDGLETMVPRQTFLERYTSAIAV